MCGLSSTEDVSAADGSAFLCGWSGVEQGYRWTEAKTAMLVVALPSHNACLLQLDLEPFVNDSVSSQSLEIRTYGRLVGKWSLAGRAKVSTLVLLAADAMGGKNLIVDFTMPDCHSPESVGLSNDTRALGFRLFGVSVTPFRSESSLGSR